MTVKMAQSRAASANARITALACLLLALILGPGGCLKIGPEYTRPEVALSEKWQDTDNRRVKGDSEEHRDWWRVFKDTDLDRLVDTAYRENLSLRIAGVRVLEARAQLGAVTGQLYPQSQAASGSYQRIRTSERTPTAVSLLQPTYGQATLGFGASWEIDFWGKFRRAVESADASLLASIADYDSTLVSLTGDVANLYIVIRTLEKRLAIARQNVGTQKESLRIAEARFEGGTTSQRDVEQAKTILANTQSVIPTLETQLRQARNALSVLLGRPPEHLSEFLKASAPIPAPPPQVAVGIPADLLRRRPDIKSAELTAWAQCAQIGVTKADLLPAFSLAGNIGFTATDVGRFALGDLTSWRSRTTSFGPSFQWNILNYGQITNQVRVQDARFQELLLAYQNTVLKAQQDVEDSLVGFLRSQERAKFLGSSTEAAQRSLDLAILQYREGITDFTTVLTAQQSLLISQDSLAQTLGDISQNLVLVYRSLGGGWQIREGQDFVPQAVKDEMAKRTNWGRLLSPGAMPAPDADKPRPTLRPPDW